MHACCHVWLFAIPWTAAHQATLSMGFPRQEYWNGLQFLSQGDLFDPGIEPMSPALAGGFLTSEPAGKPKYIHILYLVNSQTSSQDLSLVMWREENRNTNQYTTYEILGKGIPSVTFRKVKVEILKGLQEDTNSIK